MIDVELAQYFDGPQWEAFLDAASSAVRPDHAPLLTQLRDLGIPRDVATALVGVFQNEAAVAWVQGPVPLLGDARPMDLVQDRSGLKAVKVCIMRFP